MKGQHGRRVVLTSAVKRSLAAVALLFTAAGVLELYMLANPEQIAPISHAWWWMGEAAPWITVVLGGVGGAFYSHFFWYLRPGDFWAPINRRGLLLYFLGIVYVALPAMLGGWALASFTCAFMAGAVAAHRWWYRIESFEEHLEQFHGEG